MLWYQYQIPLSASISVRDIQTLYTLITAAIHPCAGAQGVLAARLKNFQIDKLSLHAKILYLVYFGILIFFFFNGAPVIQMSYLYRLLRFPGDVGNFCHITNSDRK